MIVLAVTWVAKEGQEEKVATLFRQLTEASLREPGCLGYVVHRHRDNPRQFFLYETYRDEAALEAHRQAPHFLQIARGSLPELAERKDVNLYLPLD